ncbi:MAG: hypothetical protein QG608_3461 [Actinomycetota bacterium]|nr:hypothetical protein [Actinomycetota bacterium]
MPLSENEQRVLEQMERALYDDDPKFASTMRGPARGAGVGRRIIIGVSSVVGGLFLLVLSIAQQQVALGVAGFVVMLGGTTYAVSKQRRSGPTGVVGAGGKVRPASRTSRRRKRAFMQRLEERWERRRDER